MPFFTNFLHHVSTMSFCPTVEQYPTLPVSQHREKIIRAIAENQVVVVVGDTGSGKTTQLPKMAMEYTASVGEDVGRVGCTQPRRIAAASVSKRVAEELSVGLGNEVGYQVRFEDQCSKDTKIKFMTDGILLAETQGDPELKQYQVLIIDEAHERSLNIDFLLGYLNQLLERRKDLKLVISSATLDAGAFAEFFKDAPVIEVEGRTFPVETHYFPNEDDLDLSQHVLEACEWVRSVDGSGDVLVFLPGEREIRECAEALEGQRWARTEILPLFARLGMADQQKVFRTLNGVRRIVLATNVAETSLTIPGIVYVIDSGVARMSRWNPSRQVQRLQIEKVSQASARQRKGRCGRVRDGVCVRLYDEEDHDERSEYTDPEIRRSSLAGVILRMKSLGLPEIAEFPFIDPPSPKHISEGYRTLREIGALSKTHDLMPAGRKLSRLPVDPRLGRMLLEASRRHCLAEMLVVVSGLSIMDPKERPQEKQQQADQAHAQWKHADSDFMSLLVLWHALQQFRKGGEGRNARQWNRNQLRRYCKKNFLNYRRVLEWDNLLNELRQLCMRGLKWKVKDLEGDLDSWAHEDEIHKSILAGIPQQIGVFDREKRSFKGAQGREFAIFPGSGLFNRKKKPAWLIAFEMVDTTRLWSRRNAILRPEWVEEVAPHLCRTRYHSARWDVGQGAVYAKEVVTCASLTIIEGRNVHYGKIQPEAAREVFIREALMADGMKSRQGILKRLDSLRKQVAEIEQKLRRVDGIWAEELVYHWFNENLPAEMNTAKQFIQWNKNEAKKCKLGLGDVVYEDLRDLAIEDFPETIELGDDSYSVYYRTAPGEPDDGVTLGVHVDQLALFSPSVLEWGVLGTLEERVFLLIRSLPKSQRIACNPARERAQQFAHESREMIYQSSLLGELAKFLTRIAGQRIEPDMFDLSRLPSELITKVWVCDDDGNEMAFGEDLESIKKQLGEVMTTRFEESTGVEWEVTGMKSWECEPLPTSVQKPQGLAYPALLDEGATVGVKVYADPDQARNSHRSGAVRLFLLAHVDQAKYLSRNMPLSVDAKMYLPLLGEAGVDQTAVLHWAVEAAFGMQGRLPRSADEFSDRAGAARGDLHTAAQKVADVLGAIIDDYRAIDLDLAGWRNDQHLSEVAEDLDEQMRWLLRKEFVSQTDWATLQSYKRWFAGMRERMNRAQAQPLIKDLEKMDKILDLWEPWYGDWVERKQELKLVNAGFALQELRLNAFAPNIPVLGKVSEKRVRQELESAGVRV